MTKLIIQSRNGVAGLMAFAALAVALAWSVTAAAEGSGGAGRMQLALKDVACVQQCNNEIRTCRFGCDEGFRVCMERVGMSNPCSVEKQSCNTGCTGGHNVCVARCPER